MTEDRDKIRTFICIDLPETVKDRLDELVKLLRTVDAQVSWVRSKNIHLTIKFLGNVAVDKLDAVKNVVQRAAASAGPIEIVVGGVGCFPSARSPRVLWVGLAGVPAPLVTLYNAIEDGLDREGFAREKRKFAPHLTIGRLRSPRNGQQLSQKLTELGFEPEPFTAREIIVMRSDLKPTGSIYTPQLVAPLQGKATAGQDNSAG